MFIHVYTDKLKKENENLEIHYLFSTEIINISFVLAEILKFQVKFEISFDFMLMPTTWIRVMSSLKSAPNWMQ